MLLYLLIYLFVGVVVVIGAAILLLIKAIRKGYDIDMINEVVSRENADVTKADVIWGICVWPIRIMHIMDKEKQIFEALEQYNKGSK